jgi:hypothetical protein
VNKEPPNVSHDHETDEARPEPTRRWKNLHRVGLAAFILAVAVAAIGIQARRHDETQVTQWTQDAAIPTVAVIAPEQGASDLQLVLPGNMQAWFEAPIYARVDGYVKNWYFDIGARVKKGQVLAELAACRTRCASNLQPIELIRLVCRQKNLPVQQNQSVRG